MQSNRVFFAPQMKFPSMFPYNTSSVAEGFPCLRVKLVLLARVRDNPL